MAFWSSETLRVRLESADIIRAYRPERVRHCAYELSLGDEAFITSGKSSTKTIIGSREQIAIPPGQFGLLLTEEYVTIPTDAIALISIKAGIQFRGLVNVSGFHVDPGFSGKLKFSVFNAGSEDVVLEPGEATFLIWFCNLDLTTSDIYAGAHMGQTTITSADVSNLQGEIASPGSLKRQIDLLKSDVRFLKEVMILLFVIGAGIWATRCQGAPPAGQGGESPTQVLPSPPLDTPTESAPTTEEEPITTE